MDSSDAESPRATPALDTVFSVASVRNLVPRHEPDEGFRNWSSEEANMSALCEDIHVNIREEYIREDCHRRLATFRLISILTYIQSLGDHRDAAVRRPQASSLASQWMLVPELEAPVPISLAPSVALHCEVTTDDMPEGKSLYTKLKGVANAHQGVYRKK